MRRNDIVFFNLHRKYLNVNPRYDAFNGIYTLAAFLNENGYNAQGYAGELNNGKRWLDEICSNNKTSAIGLYCDYENVTENIFLSSYIKNTYRLPVFVGGPQATALNEDFIIASKCDAVVRYEGELTVLELLHYFLDDVGDLSNIQGIVYKNENGIFQNTERAPIENLDALPFINDECRLIPDYDNDILSIMTGRGCPFNCAFCHEGQHSKRVRLRSIENVLAEIEQFLLNRTEKSTAYIYFTDDTFTLNLERVKELCAGLQKLRKIKDFRWFCEGHIHTIYLHPEMLTYMVKAGMKRIQLGIESGTQKVLNAYRKGSTKEEIEFVVKKCVEAGVEQIFGNIILSGAFFDRDVFENEKQFAKELLEIAPGRIELGVVSYWPLPNTSITNNPDYYGIEIVDKEFITSVGDFPQIKTKIYDRLDIATMMLELEIFISETMKKIIKSGKLSTDMIISWFPSNIGYKSAGQWYYQLQTMPNVYNYYMLLNNEEAYEKEALKDFDYYELHPMRTVPLYKNMILKGNGIIEVFGVLLNAFEQDVLIYATGKLSINEILKQLSKLWTEENNLSGKLEACLCKLEKNYLVVYSKF